MNIGTALIFITCISFGLGNNPQEEPSQKNVTPEYLDMLLKEKKYEEFTKALGLPSVDLVRPSEDARSEDPMFNKALEYGDMIIPKGTEERQGINFGQHGSYRWPNSIPYTISNEFDDKERDTINNAIKSWNDDLGNCLRWVPRRNEDNYVQIFPGQGCWSYLGRQGGGAQGLSLQHNGCVWHGIVLHEMDHAAGFTHEHNRNDRDNFVEVLWGNIPQEWHSQYDKVNPPTFGLQGSYDYYSVMHYGMQAPGTGKDAFRILGSNVDERWIGQRWGFTEMDKQKIKELYRC